MSDDESWLMSTRIQRGEAPPSPSRIDKCKVCGHSVWRAHSSPQDLPVMCMECFAERRRNHPEEEFNVMPPTQAQMDSLEAWLKKKN